MAELSKRGKDAVQQFMYLLGRFTMAEAQEILAVANQRLLVIANPPNPRPPDPDKPTTDSEPTTDSPGGFSRTPRR